jgi:hypothetical protein
MALDMSESLGGKLLDGGVQEIHRRSITEESHLLDGNRL